MIQVKFDNIDEYIAGFPENVQIHLQQIREKIQQAAPDASNWSFRSQ